jgi:alkaline phosphatase
MERGGVRVGRRVPSGMLERREFLRTGLGAGAALWPAGAGVSGALAAARGAGGAEGPARNVIFMVADGMSTGTLTLGDMMSHALHGRASAWVDLWVRPGVRRAACATYSADSMVTDSAASASAWGIGEKINNEVVNITPDGREPEPLWVRARRAGKATGLVTTTRVTHATPAGFIANIPHRNLEDGIAEQIVTRGVDVVLGGGSAHFPESLIGGRPGLEVVRNRGELLGLAPGPLPADGRVLGLFTRKHMHHEVDLEVDEPSLLEMTRAALSMLSESPGGFALMVEGGRVDHGAHENDAAAMLFDQLAFDAALGAAAEFAHQRDDTLLIVTTDHGTANPGLTFYGASGLRAFERCTKLKRSFEWVGAQLSAEGSMDAKRRRLGAVVEEATGVGLSADEQAHVLASMEGRAVDPFLSANGSLLVLGSVLANHLGIAFASPNHTSDFVEVTALGPGSEMLPPMIELTHLHRMVVAALGLPAV